MRSFPTKRQWEYVISTTFLIYEHNNYTEVSPSLAMVRLSKWRMKTMFFRARNKEERQFSFILDRHVFFELNKRYVHIIME